MKNLQMYIKQSILLFVALIMSVLLGAQTTPPENWYLLNPNNSDYYGINLEDTYQKLLDDKKGREVIVAIIDSGVDIEHEDLDDNVWVNEDEVPDNGKDDDDNGYVDDVHGWNFIGGPDGNNVHKDNLEVTRLLRKYEKEYGDIENPTKLSDNRKKEYAYYLTLKKDVKKQREQALDKLQQYKSMKENLLSAIDRLNNALGDKDFTLENIQNLDAGDDSRLNQSKHMAAGLMSQIPDDVSSAEDLKKTITKELDRAIDHFDTKANYQYNADFDPRHIVGDDYDDPKQRIYGNKDVEGPDAFHGTHVAGIIGAERNNDTGIDGIVKNIQIMSVRTVPDGDERDKDVANAIRYAVDNGASVINMSFGKGFSWNKKIVDKAVKYAAKKDVLLVHAAGNSSSNNDSTSNYPNDQYIHSGLFTPDNAPNWIEVGAIHWKKGKDFVAPFSNYGAKQVDIFAPGMSMYSTGLDNSYEWSQGTSMAAPVVSGVAALVRSHFPELDAEEVKEILMKSASREWLQVQKPGTDKTVPFQSLSVSGGVVNAWGAFMVAMRETGKYQDTYRAVRTSDKKAERVQP